MLGPFLSINVDVTTVITTGCAIFMRVVLLTLQRSLRSRGKISMRVCPDEMDDFLEFLKMSSPQSLSSMQTEFVWLYNIIGWE